MDKFEILRQQLENLGSRKILFILEGRDASGKGGFVKYLNANDISYLYLHQGRGTATRQKKWLSDYKKEILSLPKGKLIIYDRSWHTRTWYHYPLGYCTKRQYQNQLRNVLKWEKKLESDYKIEIIKNWISMTKKDQEKIIANRKIMKPEKYSESDGKAVELFDQLTYTKEHMFVACPTWNIVDKYEAKEKLLEILIRETE
jgi:polyphosphate kinase 2 (PPK2 family)